MVFELRPWLLFQASRALATLRQIDEAIRLLQRVAAESPSYLPAWRSLGFLLAQSERHPEALAALQRAVALDPSDANTRFNLGFLLDKGGEPERARAEFEETVRLLPSHDRAWYGLGLIQIKDNQFAEAARALGRAAALQYFNPYAGYYLAFAWFKLGEHDKASAEYQRVKSFDPKMAEQMQRDFGVK